jgi:hypothetical protein
MITFAVGQAVWIRSPNGVMRGKIACLIMPGHRPDGLAGRVPVRGFMLKAARSDLSYVVVARINGLQVNLWPEASALERV